MISHRGIDLTQARVNLFNRAGISSIQDLKNVLDALDLSCKIELQEVDVRPPAPPKETSNAVSTQEG